MNPEDTDELTMEERDALRALPREEATPAWLEERVVNELSARGFLRARRPARRWIGAAGTLAASLVIFAMGLAAGRYMPAAPATPGAPASLETPASPETPAVPAGVPPRFVLLLYEDARYAAPEPAGMADRVREYGDWIRALGTGGRFVDGEKLKTAADVLPAGSGPAAGGPGLLAGYFIIAAEDRAEAIDIARRCPHLRYGGTIVVREIDPV